MATWLARSFAASRASGRARCSLICRALSLASLLTGRPARSTVAMTGEITLRGKVLPVGGIKEKILAAKRAGIERVVVPERNRRDVEEVSTELLEGLDLEYVGVIDEVLQHLGGNRQVVPGRKAAIDSNGLVLGEIHDVISLE